MVLVDPQSHHLYGDPFAPSDSSTRTFFFYVLWYGRYHPFIYGTWRMINYMVNDGEWWWMTVNIFMVNYILMVNDGAEFWTKKPCANPRTFAQIKQYSIKREILSSADQLCCWIIFLGRNTRFRSYFQWIGLRENWNRKAPYFMGKSMVSGSDFPD
jgi:hypothetical protein